MFFTLKKNNFVHLTPVCKSLSGENGKDLWEQLSEISVSGTSL